MNFFKRLRERRVPDPLQPWKEGSVTGLFHLSVTLACIDFYLEENIESQIVDCCSNQMLSSRVPFEREGERKRDILLIRLLLETNTSEH